MRTELDQARPCSNANAVAADREETPSFVKMWVRWLVTVFSLMNRAAAISRLELPLALLCGWAVFLPMLWLLKQRPLPNALPLPAKPLAP